MKTAIDVTVIFYIGEFEQNLPMEFKTYNIPNIGDIISPFLQSYKYRVKSVSDNWSVITIHLEPYCDFAKKVYEQQYGSVGKS